MYLFNLYNINLIHKKIIKKIAKFLISIFDNYLSFFMLLTPFF